MICFQNLPRSSCLTLQRLPSYDRKSSCSVNLLMSGKVNATETIRKTIRMAVSNSTPSIDTDDIKVDENELSEVYSDNMTKATGAALTYQHELGMNYNFILPDLIVGSCLQNVEDVDKLRKIGVRTIFCLQQDPDLEWFGVDIKSIREYANSRDDIQHLRAEIRDFDGFDLRMKLPAVVSKLHKAIKKNGGVTYIHCTAGIGRAPAVAMAHMFWARGFKLIEAHSLLTTKRSCCPSLDAVKSATADILAGVKNKSITLMWNGDNCSKVEISGLDVGWGQRIPLQFDEEKGVWILHREMPEGVYEYKYIVDGEWTSNENEPVVGPNKDGHVNNYVKVFDDEPDSISAKIRERMREDDPHLTENERLVIRQFLKEE